MTLHEQLIAEFRRKLEDVLDEQFPKIEKEGAAKIANRRGAGLVLYSEAVILAKALYSQAHNAAIREAMEKIKETEMTLKSDALSILTSLLLPEDKEA